MNLFIKLSIIPVAFGVFVSYLIHHSLPDDVPNRFAVQFANNIVFFIETLASVREYLGFKNRWQPYNIDFGSPSFPEDVNHTLVKFAGVKCIVLTPKNFNSSAGLGPAIVFYHGGGFMSGSINSYHMTLIYFARNTGLVVVAPEYRLAPEHPFPIPFEDCLHSTLEFFDRAKEFGVNPKQIVLSGDSAGGNLAISVALQLAKMDEKANYKPSMVVPICPMIQMSNFQLPSHQQNVGYVFKKTTLAKFWLSYIGLNHRMDLGKVISVNGHVRERFKEKFNLVDVELIPQKYKLNYNSTPVSLTSQQTDLLDHGVLEIIEKIISDVRAAPLMASDEELMLLPPVYITVNEYDQLRDEGIIFYQRLKKLKKEVTFHFMKKSIHISFQIGVLFPNSFYDKENMIVMTAIKKHFEV